MMNRLKIVKCKSEKSFNDIIKIASFDNNNNIVKEMCFEDIIEFDIDDNVDIEANNIRHEVKYLRKKNNELKHRVYVLELYIEELQKDLKDLKEE